MRNRFIFILLFSGILQTQAQDILRSLDDCLQTALKNNLELQTGHIAIARAKALQGTAFNPERTSFSLSQDPTSGGSPDNSITVSQEFDFPTVYTSRHRLLRSETALEEQRLEVSRQELIRQVSLVYNNLLYQQRLLQILNMQDSICQQFVQNAAIKKNAGDISQLEELNANLLLQENQMAIASTQADYDQAIAELQSWLNTEAAIVPTEQLEPLTTEALGTFMAESTPIARELQQQQTVSRQQLEVARQGWLPSFSIALRNQMLLKGFNPYDQQRERFSEGNFMGFEVGVSVPLFYGEQRAKVKAAKREVEMADKNRQQAILSLQSQYRQGELRVQKAKQRMDYYTTTALSEADKISSLTQVMYTLGEIGYMEYIQNLIAAANIRQQHAQAVSEYNQAIIELNAIQGNERFR